MKTTRVSKDAQPSARQRNVKKWLEGILDKASDKKGRYGKIDDETAGKAAEFLDDLRGGDYVSKLIGVDLFNETISVKPWK